ncbi:MAG: 6-phosphofructokinase, partial [Deltaproteobacteria bacterium]|nr:6-phosphofructokinase [Deltaproteobacteria bacterium]
MKEKYRVLMVDGDASSRDACLRVLGNHPEFHAEEASCAKEALEKIAKAAPDIVICDQRLSDMEGIAFCRRLKEDAESPLANVYFIMVGAEDGEQDRMLSVVGGADDFLPKPLRPDELLARLKVGQRISSLLRKTELEYRQLFEQMDVLLIQEGGCAPGYNPVTAFVTYHLEGQGRKVYATREGFKSLVLGKDEDFIRLVYDPERYKRLDHIPGVFHAAPLSEWRGALLRSERYREFVKAEIQKRAVASIKRKKVNALIAIGGNGTFRGIRSLCEMMPTSIQVFFIPVTIDSDVAGTECIGQHTGVEMGAERIRCYMADARTHKRIYIVEMMGANSGYHALH